MSETPETIVDESQLSTMLSPNTAPIYAKCISCQDYGVTCRGFDLVSLGDIGAVRAFHRAVKKAHGLSLKAVAAAAPIISEYTISEYFSNVVKNDYKWTTVVSIDNALLSICGHRVGLPPLDHSCPSASSEYRNQLAAADLKLVAADLNLANAQAECEELRRRMADSDGSHLAQLSDLQSAKQGELEWMKDEVRLWRRFAFILLGVGFVLLACLLFYIAWDFLLPASGFIRY